MSATWEAKWKLSAASLDYADLITPNGDNEFELKDLGSGSGKGRAYVVKPKTTTSMAPAWDHCILLARNREQPVLLPWPLPNNPTPDQAIEAGKYIRSQINQLGAGKNQVERLEGDVLVHGREQRVTLYCVAKGYQNGKALLVVYLDEPTSPDGSVVGGRTN